MAEVKWIKICTDIFNNKKIRLIESMPEGNAIIVVWFKILMLAGTVNDSGNIYLTKDIPYTEQMLATLFNRPLPLIQLALSTFEQFEMIEIINDIIHVTNWEKYQNVEGMERIREQTRLRVSKYREQKKIECNVTGNVTVTQSNATDIDKEKDIDRDIKERNIKERKASNQKVVSKKPTNNKFVPPTVDEIRAYCIERKNNVDPQAFYDYYAAANWHDSKGNPVKNWKQRMVTWEGKRNGNNNNPTGNNDSEIPHIEYRLSDL